MSAYTFMDKIFRILMYILLYLFLRFSLTLIDSLDTLVVGLILLELFYIFLNMCTQVLRI